MTICPERGCRHPIDRLPKCRAHWRRTDLGERARLLAAMPHDEPEPDTRPVCTVDGCDLPVDEVTGGHIFGEQLILCAGHWRRVPQDIRLRLHDGYHDADTVLQAVDRSLRIDPDFGRIVGPRHHSTA